MQARLFFGNLSWNTTAADLSALVSEHAAVLDANVITDRDTGRSRGFGFVTIESERVPEVIRALDGQNVDGRAIRVNTAEDKPRRERDGFAGRGRRY